MRHYFLCSIAIAAILFISSCENNRREEGGIHSENEYLTLQDLAFNPVQESPYRVYIEENGKMVSYLVLADDYHGHCLLLREYLLDELVRFNPGGRDSAYYENSEIDVFLNTDFYETLSPTIMESIVESTIEITAKDSLGIGGKDITSITRKVFLLSYTEVNESFSRVILKEGKPLAYFSTIASRIAYHCDGQIGGWWLRTPSPSATDLVTGVAYNGAVGTGGVYGFGPADGAYINGVRPAFCLPRDISIEESVVDGLKVYLISL